MAFAPGSDKPANPFAVPIARREPVMKADKLQPPSTFYRMIEAHGDQALIDSFLLRQPSVGERLAAGKALRKQVPRSAHAAYAARTDRPDPVDVLKQQDVARVKELLPVRYG